MFKNFKIMIVLYCLTTASVQASLYIAIPARDFCVGNSLVLIAHDGNGLEQVAGCISFNDGKTQFSYDEILDHNVTLLSIAEQDVAVVSVLKHDQTKLDDESIIYVCIEVNPSNVVRVLLIKNNFLADNPFDVVEFLAASYLDELDDEDDCFDSMSHDELSHFNLIDIENTQPVELSTYDKMLLSFYAMWAVQSMHVKETYKNFKDWIASHYAQ